MKNKNLFLLTILLFFVSIIQAQVQLPNPDFENWDNINHATDWTSYDFLYIYHTAEQSTEASHGTYGVKLETWYLTHLNVLFGQIDKLDTSRVMVIMTTNRIDLIDEALKDRLLLIEFPLPLKEVLKEVAQKRCIELYSRMVFIINLKEKKTRIK